MLRLMSIGWLVGGGGWRAGAQLLSCACMCLRDVVGALCADSLVMVGGVLVGLLPELLRSTSENVMSFLACGGPGLSLGFLACDGPVLNFPACIGLVV